MSEGKRRSSGERGEKDFRGELGRRSGGEKMVKVGGLGGGLLMVPCYVFFIFISNLLTTLSVFKRGFLGSLFIVFVKVITWVNCRLVHCWAGG